MADVRRVKVVVTGYYDIDMADAKMDYGTTDPVEMLKIDQGNANNRPRSVTDWCEDGLTVELSWEN